MKKLRFKVGDEVVVCSTPYVDEELYRKVTIVEILEQGDTFDYRTTWENHDSGNIFKDSELRFLTKLERALK